MDHMIVWMMVVEVLRIAVLNCFVYFAFLVVAVYGVCLHGNRRMLRKLHSPKYLHEDIINNWSEYKRLLHNIG